MHAPDDYSALGGTIDERFTRRASAADRHVG